MAVMRIEKRSMNWLPRPSAYDQIRQQNARRREAHQSFINSQQSLVNAIGNIMSNYNTSISELAASATLARVRKSA